MLIFEMLAEGFYLLSASMTNEPGKKSHGMKKKFPELFDFLRQALN
jgi:hypothetical protein